MFPAGSFIRKGGERSQIRVPNFSFQSQPRVNYSSVGKKQEQEGEKRLPGFPKLEETHGRQKQKSRMNSLFPTTGSLRNSAKTGPGLVYVGNS